MTLVLRIGLNSYRAGDIERLASVSGFQWFECELDTAGVTGVVGIVQSLWSLCSMCIPIPIPGAEGQTGLFVLVLTTLE